MKIYKLFAALLLIFCSGIFSSCKKNEECKTCKPVPPDFIRSVSISIDGHTQNLANLQVWDKSFGAYTELADGRLADEVYNSIDDRIKNLTASSQHAVLTVLYLNKKLSDIGEISQAIVKGVSRFYPDANMLQHEFYTRSGDEFIKDRYLSVHSYAVSTSAIYEINNSIIKSDNSSVIIIDSKKGIDYEVKNNIDILRKVALNYTTIKNHFENGTGSKTQPATESEIFLYTDESMPEPGTCGSPCTERKPNSFCARDLGQMHPVAYKCYSDGTSGGSGGGGTCRTQTNRTQLLEADAMTRDSIYSAHNDSLHYSTRTLFNRSEFGKKYIAYYYYFSRVYQGNVDLFTAVKTARVLFLFNVQLRKLLSSSGYTNEIFMSRQMKEMIVSLINDYKNIYNDAYNDAFLNDILADLNRYQGKTVSEIATLL